MGKPMKKILWVIILVFLYYRYFYYADIGYGCYISIRPSLELSNRNMKRS